MGLLFAGKLLLPRQLKKGELVPVSEAIISLNNKKGGIRPTGEPPAFKSYIRERRGRGILPKGAPCPRKSTIVTEGFHDGGGGRAVRTDPTRKEGDLPPLALRPSQRHLPGAGNREVLESGGGGGDRPEVQPQLLVVRKKKNCRWTPPEEKGSSIQSPFGGSPPLLPGLKLFRGKKEAQR